jgi:glycine dehydrogenase
MPISFKKESFANRHIGISESELSEMLSTIQADSLDQLIDETVPAGIRMQRSLNVPKALSERDFLEAFRALANKNQVFTSYIGMGYYDTVTPNVIKRNILENPGWYTAYTPYQAEIAQGRLEALINFQTAVSELTGMDLANASLLDEGTAAAEAMTMLHGSRSKKTKKNANRILVDALCHPQTVEVLQTRAEPVDIVVDVRSVDDFDVASEDVFALIVSYPNTEGGIRDFSALFAAAHENDVANICVADLLSLTLLKSPGQMGADVVVGSSQRFGVPMGYGGPHAAFFATKESFKRNIPGRIIGVTVNREGQPAYRMALQTREQHIRREKATSNICTAQVLLAVIAGAYACYHGPEGLKRIASRTHGLALALRNGAKKLGIDALHEHFFDTVTLVFTEEQQSKLQALAVAQNINLRYYENGSVGISFDEAKHVDDLQKLLDLLSQVTGKTTPSAEELTADLEIGLPEVLRRQTDFMEHPVFNSFHTEHDMLRYLKQLENRDLSMVHSMITLGSCTMKLNATAEMIPLTWPEFGGLHPFCPADQAAGYHQMFEELEAWLSDITGFEAVSLQPNSGAQGEYTGLMTIRAYHKAHGQAHRDVAIIPSSAHGTNPASAVMSGMQVVVTKCDDQGNIDMDDLRQKVEKHSENLAALMVTYPSTHGVFEESIKDICQLIHDHGGLVYMDGANMNAQVGLTSPGIIGADVCHLNLHKTFCIPHGGGGPGMGPIGVNAKLAPFLPKHSLVSTGGSDGITAVSAAPWGSASILTISYAYIRMMGSEGLTNATKYAILNANYMKDRLKDAFEILYLGKNGRSAHEFIVDLRGFKSVGIEAVDIAKRLMDYGFHAPTMSFPVAGTVMIEPTESESKAELDRFCDALLSIREEIAQVERGEQPQGDNVLNNAPHTASMLLAAEWDKPYSREQAAFPLPWISARKFWPMSSRVDDAYGDRNLVCSCVPIEEYAE